MSGVWNTACGSRRQRRRGRHQRRSKRRRRTGLWAHGCGPCTSSCAWRGTAPSCSSLHGDAGRARHEGAPSAHSHQLVIDLQHVSQGCAGFSQCPSCPPDGALGTWFLSFFLPSLMHSVKFVSYQACKGLGVKGIMTDGTHAWTHDRPEQLGPPEQAGRSVAQHADTHTMVDSAAGPTMMQLLIVLQQCSRVSRAFEPTTLHFWPSPWAADSRRLGTPAGDLVLHHSKQNGPGGGVAETACWY